MDTDSHWFGVDLACESDETVYVATFPCGCVALRYSLSLPNRCEIHDPAPQQGQAAVVD